MKKYILFFGLMLCICKGVFAQSYTVEQIPFLPFSLTLEDTLMLRDDRYSEPIPIGFDFCFFGQSYDSIRISSNSYITFILDTAILGQYSPWAISGSFPDSTLLKNTIMFPWQDLNPAVGGNILYNSFGTAPCRKFVISFNGLSLFSCGGQPFSSQLVLYEGSNVIETYIANKALCSSWNGGQAVHGLQNAGGTEAVIVPGRNAGVMWQAQNDAWRFTPTNCPADTNSCDIIEYSIITGRLYLDNNNNCTYENGDQNWYNWHVTASPGNYSALTDADGIYKLFVFDTGTYQLDFDMPPDMQSSQCAQNVVSFTTPGDTTSIDLMMEPFECATIIRDIQMPDYIPCDTFEFQMIFKNYGNGGTGNTTITTLPSFPYQIVSCNYSYTQVSDTLFINLPGGITPDQTDTVRVKIIIPCDINGMICCDTWMHHEATSCINPNIYEGECVFGVSVNDPHLNNINMYPNPASGFVTISGITQARYLLHLYDITGRLLNSYILNENTTTLDLTSFSEGLYIYSITDNKSNNIGNGKIQLTE